MGAIKQPEAIKRGLTVAAVGLGLTGLCVAAWFVWQDRYWIAQAGPTEITLEQLAKLESPSQLPSPWVKVTFDKAVDTGVEMQEVRIGENATEYKFLLFQAGDRWMVATVPEDFRGKHARWRDLPLDQSARHRGLCRDPQEPARRAWRADVSV